MTALPLFLALLPIADEPPADLDLADYYGFGPVEVYEADGRHSRLIAGDFGGDDRTDLAVIDNGGSQIKLWIQTDDADERTSDNTVNGYLLPGRLRTDKVLVDREVFSLVAGDFNGDGEDDLATIEGGDIVQVRLQTDGRFREQPALRLPDLGTDAIDLAAGDFDADGRDDLVALGVNATYLVIADAEADDGFADPIRIPNTSDDLDFAELVDLDGDDRLDLYYAAFGESGYTNCVRLQQGGSLGPELRMEEDDLRAVAIADCDDWPGAEVITIDDGTGRVKIEKLQRQQGEDGRRLAQLGLGGAKRSDRGWAVADLDGDGRVEVVVSDPEAAELLLLRADRTGLQPAERFPSLLGIKQVAVQPRGEIDPRDMMSRPKSDLIVLSDEEETVAVVRLGQDGLALPQPLAVEGTPKALAASGESVFVLTDGPKRGNDYALALVGPEVQGRRSVEAMDPDRFPADDLGADELDVQAMRAGDFDGDDLPDLLLIGRRKPALMLFGRQPSADDPALFETRESNGFSLPEVDAAKVTIGRSDDDRRDTLLFAQGRYGRELVWRDGGWQVADQVNAPSSGARVDLLRLLPGGGSAVVDNEADRLSLVDADGDVAEESELGSLDVQDVAIADIDGDQRSDLLLLAGSRLGVLASRSERRELQTIATYEVEDDDAYFADVVAGDFNNDGLTDLIINETGENTLEIAAIAPEPTEILRADRFKLYEEKSFRRGNGGGGGPREMLAADLTGDGLTDLVLLIRDRLLLFPQDDGED